MRYRFLLFAAAFLTGCTSTTAIPRVDESQIVKLKADNTGIVLMHTVVSGHTPNNVMVKLARPNARGHYEATRSYQLKIEQDSSQLPGQLTLPAGHYGIVDLTVEDNIDYAARRMRSRGYHASDMKLEGPLLNQVYERPIATFSVEAGEVVDIGSLQLIDGPVQRDLFVNRGSFAVKVTPMSEIVIKNLKERSPA